MAKYNSGLKYNSKNTYNSAPIIIFVYDSGSGSDSVEILVAVPIDETGTGTDAALVNALVALIDSSIGQDTVDLQYTAIVSDTGTGADVVSIPDITIAVDDSGVGTDAVNINAALAVTDAGQGNDTITATGNISMTDTGQGDDSVITSATVPIADSASGVDITKVAKTYYLVDENNILQPLNVKVLRDSLVDLMPEIKVESDTIPGKHGEIYFDSKLGARAIELKVLANDFTAEQREALKRTMAQYLNPVGDAKSLVFVDDVEKQYMVKYAGKIDLAQYPTWLQFVIPFKSALSYILGAFEEIKVGSGTIINIGNEDTPLVIEVAGPVTNPSVVVGTYTLAYTGTIDPGSTLIIDVESMTVELDGVNALPDYSGGFPWLPVGSTTVTAASAGTTTFRYRGRWL